MTQIGILLQAAYKINIEVFLTFGLVVAIIIAARFFDNNKKRFLFFGIGAILGIPLSYYFQSEMVKNKMGGVSGYLQNFDQILRNSDLIGNVVISIIIFAIVGGVIGYFIDENEAKKEK
ncbi:MAG: hypothetical protein WCH34_18160 [Bacteroidota bacterium]